MGLNSRATTEWNLLTALAQAENFALSVVGTTLNFGPVPSAPPMFVVPGDLISLTVDTAATLPQTATVKSWNTRQKATVTQSQGSGAGTTIIRPNLTALQAQTMAVNHLAALAQHTTILTAVMPAELTLAPGMQLILDGTDSAFDQSYTVSAISRRLQAQSGFIQTIRAYATATN